MMGQQTMLLKRTLMLLTAMLGALVLASGVASAVNKVCPSGSTEQNPCLGTNKTKRASGNDTLIGTNGPDYIKALSGNDKISGAAGDDTTDGGTGNDTYSYKDGWGTDTLIDASGIDALNFSAVGSVGGAGVEALLVPEFHVSYNSVIGPNGDRINPSPSTAVEKVTGSSQSDFIVTGKEANTLQPGPGTGGADLRDYGGISNSSGVSIPVSNDTYSGFSATGYGNVSISDLGGTADKLVLPFASTDAYFEAYDIDTDGAKDTLLILTSSSDSVLIYSQLEPIDGDDKGHLEQIRFTDTILAIGSETDGAQTTLSADKTTGGSAEAQVEKLNEASSLDAAEKEKRKEAAKKIMAEAEKKAQDLDEKLAPSGGEEKR
jgi:Ca2+-binding RTX toxin-like protein